MSKLSILPYISIFCGDGGSCPDGHKFAYAHKCRGTQLTRFSSRKEEKTSLRCSILPVSKTICLLHPQSKKRPLKGLFSLCG